MRPRELIVFFTIALLIYALANTYIFIKGQRALADYVDKGLYALVFIVLALTFIAGKILERNSSSIIVDILNVAGGFWLAFMLYATLILFVSDILQWTIRLAGLLPLEKLSIYKVYSYMISVSLTIIIIGIGFFHSILTVPRNYDIKLEKTFSNNETVRIAAISDVHLGSIIRHRSLRQLSGKLEEARPEILLFLGDLVDGEINPVIRDDLLKSLTIPSSVKHIYGITGNHEYIGGSKKAIPYIEKKGIDILLDEVVTLQDGIQLVGRKDKDSFRYSGERRKSLSELLKQTDPGKPVIVLDHQPISQKELDGNEFDLILSGHTHNGQMWPLNYVVKRIYRFANGYYNENGKHFITSSGFGTWGPRVRLGSRSEILIIDLSF